MIRISALHNEDRLQGTVNNLARGPDRPKLRIYDDSGSPQVPPSIDDAPTGVLLCEIELFKTVGTVAGNALNVTIPDDGLVLVNGRAHWARFVDGNGAAAIDCSVTDMSGAGPVRLLDLDVLGGGLLGITSAVLA